MVVEPWARQMRRLRQRRRRSGRGKLRRRGNTAARTTSTSPAVYGGVVWMLSLVLEAPLARRDVDNNLRLG
jgi:hypothetical protein